MPLNVNAVFVMNKLEEIQKLFQKVETNSQDEFADDVSMMAEQFEAKYKYKKRA